MIDHMQMLYEEFYAARTAYNRGALTRDEVNRIGNTYLDAAEERWNQVNPRRKFRRPSISYLLRAL